jgi:hypothetical protein
VSRRIGVHSKAWKLAESLDADGSVRTALQREAQRVLAEETAEMQRQRDAAIAREREALLEKMPDLRDPTKARKATEEMTDWLFQQGYSPEEIAGIYDHRLILQLHKAMTVDKAPKATVGPQKRTTSRTIVPGAAPVSSARPADDRAKAAQHHARKQSIDSAAGMFRHLID